MPSKSSAGVSPYFNLNEMSHAIGVVRFKDGSIGFFEYDGTSDTVINERVRDTYKEMKDNWRGSDNHSKCDCLDKDKEKVETFSNYGDGWYFESLFCRKHKSISTDDDSLYENMSLGAKDFEDNWAEPIIQQANEEYLKSI